MIKREIEEIPKRKNKQFQHGIKIRCVNCGEKFDLVSAVFIPICNKCRMERNAGLID